MLSQGIFSRVHHSVPSQRGSVTNAAISTHQHTRTQKEATPKVTKAPHRPKTYNLRETPPKSFVESVCSGVCRSWRMTAWNSGTVRRCQELKDRMFGIDCPENLLDWLFDFLYHDVFEKTIPKTEAVSVFDVYLPEVLVWFIMQQLGVNRLQAELIISRT